MSELDPTVLPSVETYDDLSGFIVLALKQVKRASIEGIWWRWAIGKSILDHTDRPDRIGDYAEKTLKRLAGERQLDVSELYRYIQFARKFPSKAQVANCLDSLAEKGFHSLSWNLIRKEALTDPAKDPSVIGGPKKAADHFSGILDAHMVRMETYIENGVPDELRTEVAGSLVKAAEVSIQLAKRLTTEPIELDTQATFGMRIPDASPERFAAWIRTLACVCCGTDKGIEAAHFPFSKGAGGSDRFLIPLCHLHHQEQHKTGRDTFLAAWMSQIFTFFHQHVWLYYTNFA